MSKTLLMVGGGIEALPGIRMAKEMGLHVVVSDQNLDAPGFALADDRLIVDTYDVPGTVEAAKRYHQNSRPLHGVICIASDVPHTVASVSQELGLPGIPLEAARLAMDKLAMKQKFIRDGVPVPWFSPVESIEHLREIVDRKGLPLVIKPVDSRGARGVLRLTAQVDLDWAYQLSRSHSPTQRVLVERFLPGPQISTETMMLDGEAFTPGFSDRNYEFLERFAPHVIENGGELPSHLPPTVQQDVQQVVKQTALSMGVRTGVVKGDIVVSNGEPYVIELAARLSGGYFCTHEIPLNTGVQFVEHAIRLSLGERVHSSNLEPRFQVGVAQRYLFHEPGCVVRVSNVEEAAKLPGVAFCDVKVGVGDIIQAIDSHPTRAGMVIATGGDRHDAIAKASAAIEAIHIETVPVK